jgi:hypothetical protein
MTMSNIAVHRLHSQQLEHTCLEKPGEVVRYLVAVQAKDYAGAKWSIGLRLPDSTDAGVEREIADKVFVRTWAMRGTLHFVAAPDVRWLLSLVAPRIIARNTRRYSELELSVRLLAVMRCRQIHCGAASGWIAGRCSPSSKRNRALNAAVERYCRFVGMSATVVT